MTTTHNPELPTPRPAGLTSADHTMSVQCLNPEDFRPGSVMGWPSGDSPTGWWSGVVVAVSHLTLSATVRDVMPGRFA